MESRLRLAKSRPAGGCSLAWRLRALINIKIVFCRSFQSVLWLVLPVLPYRRQENMDGSAYALAALSSRGTG